MNKFSLISCMRESFYNMPHLAPSRQRRTFDTCFCLYYLGVHCTNSSASRERSRETSRDQKASPSSSLALPWSKSFQNASFLLFVRRSQRSGFHSAHIHLTSSTTSVHSIVKSIELYSYAVGMLTRLRSLRHYCHHCVDYLPGRVWTPDLIDECFTGRKVRTQAKASLTRCCRLACLPWCRAPR